MAVLDVEAEHLEVPMLLGGGAAVGNVDEVEGVGDVEAGLRGVWVVEEAVVVAEVGSVDALLVVEGQVGCGAGVRLGDGVAVVAVPVVLMGVIKC